MSEELVLSNDVLRVTISTLGAELLSVKKLGKERIWVGDPKYWKGHSPLLFPVCGVLKDDKYIYEGKAYEMKYHGYGRFSEFEIESLSADRVVLYHRYNDNTLNAYPFKYELRVIYTIKDSELKIEYAVKNLESSEMYFSIGSHEGLYCPEGIEEYNIIFEKPESLDCACWNGGFLSHETKNIGENVKIFPLEYKNCSNLFTNINSKVFTLQNKRTGEKTILKTDGKYSCLWIWSKQNAGFVCIEPWYGMPDYFDTDSLLKNKCGIMTLAGYEQITLTHSIEF